VTCGGHRKRLQPRYPLGFLRSSFEEQQFNYLAGSPQTH